MLESGESSDFRNAIAAIEKDRDRVQGALDSLIIAGESIGFNGEKRDYSSAIERDKFFIKSLNGILAMAERRESCDISTLCSNLFLLRRKFNLRNDSIGMSMAMDLLYDIMPPSDIIGIGIPK